MKKKGLHLLLILVLALLVGNQAAMTAAPPPYLTYQGHLYDSAGLPVADGAYDLAFSLWAHGVGDEIPLWGPETYTLAVSHGYFAVTLGEGEPLPALPSPVYLEITVNGETLTPRQPVQSVAFALNAQDSVTLNGHAADYYRAWEYTLNLPAGFADGVDNDTVYTDSQALAAVAGAGYVTTPQVNTLIAAADVAWSQLSGVPVGFADGVDNDTVYTDADALDAVATAGYLTQTTAFTDAQTLNGQPGSYYRDWGSLTLMPAGFADGVDNDTVYTDSQAIAAVAGAGYLNVSDVITVMQIAGYVSQTQVATLIGAADVAWGQLSGVPAYLLDGDADTQYTAGSGLVLTGTQFTVTGAPWNGLTGIPSGFADGVDNDVNTTYTAGPGVNLNGTQFNIAPTYRLPQSCSSGQIAAWNGTAWTCAADANAGGDVTGVTAGTGLSGGGTSGAVTLSADTAYLQRRVSTACAAGSSIRAIAADGTVTCETDDDTNTTYTAGTGLGLSGTTLSVGPTYQLPQSCSSGQSAVWDGTTWVCTTPTGSTHPVNIVTVSQHGGGDFTTIAAALASITDATALKPYEVRIAPGRYLESVTLPAYVTLQGAGPDMVWIEGTGIVVQLADQTAVRDLTVYANDPALSSIGIYGNNNITAVLDNVTIYVTATTGHTATGLQVNGQFTSITAHRLLISSRGSGAGIHQGIVLDFKYAGGDIGLRLSDSRVTGVANALAVGDGARAIVTQSELSGSSYGLRLSTLSGSAQVAHSTLTGNVAGIYVAGDGPTLDLQQSYVSGNTYSLDFEGTGGVATIHVSHSNLAGEIKVGASPLGTAIAEFRHVDVSGVGFSGGGSPTCVAVSRGTSFGATTCP